MKELSNEAVLLVSGGEIIPGWPTPEIQSINVKLMVAAGRGQPGFDVVVAAEALSKYDNTNFWNSDVALEYVRNGDIPA